MKTTVVVFTKNNARILINPPDLAPYKAMPNAVINPDLQAVKGMPPHHWKLTSSGNVIPMTVEERELKAIGLTPAKMANVVELPARIINQIKLVEVPVKVKPLIKWAERIGFACLGALITMILKGVL